MYQYDLSKVEAMPLDPREAEREGVVGFANAAMDSVEAEPSLADRLMAVLIIAAVPFLLVAFMIRFVWSDVKAVGRGFRFGYRTVVEELSDRP